MSLLSFCLDHALARRAHDLLYQLLLFAFLFLSLFVGITEASSLEEVKAKAHLLQLWDHPVWRNLIHVEGKNNQSVVLSDDFFLSPLGKINPEAELMATLDAFYGQAVNNKVDPRCRFPARYYWLSQQLPIPQIDLRDPACMNPQRWQDFDRITSISLLLVSGYWGNPASTFGHALLKVNSTSPEDPHDLFDLTVNYGAITPEHENPFRYIYKGLFGGYQGVFSDQYYYTQDLTYVRTEFRDIWDFELELTENEKTLLIFHLWEIMGMKFKYYFLKENCAFRLAGLVELILKEGLSKDKKMWYLPEEMFFKLKDIDHDRMLKLGHGLVRNVRYVPSSKRVLFYEITKLNSHERKIFKLIVNNDVGKIDEYLKFSSENEKIKILNTLLAYEQFNLVSSKRNDRSKIEMIKDKILLARLQLPVQMDNKTKLPPLESAVEGARPGYIGAGIGLGRSGDSYLTLSWSGFNKESIGQNNLQGSEFALLNIRMGFFQEEHQVFVDRFDLIRILNLETMPLDVIREGKYSWSARIGLDRLEVNNKFSYDGLGALGVGQTLRVNEQILGYVMIDAAGHSIAPYGRLSPYLGLELSFGKLKTAVAGGIETSDYRGGFTETCEAKIQYQINRDYAAKIEFSNKLASRLNISFNYFW